MTRTKRPAIPKRPMRFDISDPAWQQKVVTALSFCVACHIGTLAIITGVIFNGL